jgi:hypothetical protein
MEPVVALLLSAWKNLAKAQAGEQEIDFGSCKDLRAAADIIYEHRDDWTMYKQEVLDSGRVHLIEKLVRPFLGESPLTEEMNQKSGTKRSRSSSS